MQYVRLRLAGGTRPHRARRVTRPRHATPTVTARVTGNAAHAADAGRAPRAAHAHTRARAAAGTGRGTRRAARADAHELVRIGARAIGLGLGLGLGLGSGLGLGALTLLTLTLTLTMRAQHATPPAQCAVSPTQRHAPG